MENDKTVGVVVGRFQLDQLHPAHLELLDNVRKKSTRMIIFLGVPKTVGSQKNSLDFLSRQLMLQEIYPEATIVAIPDCRYDDVWSKNLDDRIREIDAMSKITLYGGRDSFIEKYKGNFPTVVLESTVLYSATDVRLALKQEVKGDPKWRAGVIHGCNNRYPTSYQTVDIACLQDNRTKLLLAKKPGERKLRYPGGYVDVKDHSLEEAARREFYEETGGNTEITQPKYLGSIRVNDWRYVNEVDKIMTALFIVDHKFGRPEPSDDISELQWVEISELLNEGAIEEMIMEEHVPLVAMLLTELSNKK